MTRDSRNAGRGLRDRALARISTFHVFVLSGATAVATGGALIDANQALAMTNAVELVQLAHAQARTTAYRSGGMVRMDVDPEGGRITVTLMGNHARSSEVLVREVSPPAVAIESEFETICYDGTGKPVVGGDCGAQVGSIMIRTLNDETRLTLNGEGMLDLR